MIVDSSVLIPLSRIGRLELLREGIGRIFITEDVYKETVVEARGRVGASAIEEATHGWIRVEKAQFTKATRKLTELERIESADASIILLAERRGDKVLSNDSGLIRVARSRGIECWWLSTLVLNLVKKGTISKNLARKILIELIEGGLHISPRVYVAILDRINKMSA